MPEAVVMKRDAGSPWLKQVQHATLFQPSPYLAEGMISIQNGEHQGFNPAPSREDMRRVGGEEAVDHRGHFQAP
jgi:hypothetical protein